MAAVSRLSPILLPVANLAGAGASVIGATLSGTLVAAGTPQNIVDGGYTIILTLSNDTWVADDGTFDAQRQNIIDGMSAASSPGNGWNNEVRDNEVVGAVARTSDTIVTITLTAAPNYDIASSEIVTITVPASALVTSSDPVIASPTITIESEEGFELVDTLGHDLVEDMVHDLVA